MEEMRGEVEGGIDEARRVENFGELREGSCAAALIARNVRDDAEHRDIEIGADFLRAMEAAVGKVRKERSQQAEGKAGGHSDENDVGRARTGGGFARERGLGKAYLRGLHGLHHPGF